MKTVRTAVQILTLYNESVLKLSVTEVARHFGLNLSSASRLLAALASSGLIQREPDRTYRPGPLAYRLGLLYHSNTRLADDMSESARAIVNRTGMTCWVSVLSGVNALLISRFPGPRDQGFHVHPGNLLPANASAAGKALLARMGDDELRALLTPARLDAWTAKSKTDLAALLQDTELIRERGWSVNSGELFVDVVSIGVALVAPMEATPMALSISIHSAMPEDLFVGLGALTEEACRIGQRVGDNYWLSRSPVTDREAVLAELRAHLSSGD